MSAGPRSLYDAAMKIQARDIDHLSITTHSPEEFVNRLQQLGFAFTPEGAEPRCLCFQPDRDDVPNYIELAEGEPRIALAVNVAELVGEEHRHTWESDLGDVIEAGVVVGEAAGQLPWFAVMHKTPDAFMAPEWIVHPNGALGMVAVHALAQDPAALANALKRDWQATTEEVLDGCVLLKTGSVELLVWSAGAWQAEYKAIEPMVPADLPCVVGITVAVERTRPLQALLRANNVAFALGDANRVLVAAEQAAGLMIEFLPQT